MAIKLTVEQIIERLTELKFTMVNKTEYKNTKSKMVFRCEHGHEWNTQLTHVINLHSGCPGCINVELKKKSTCKVR